MNPAPMISAPDIVLGYRCRLRRVVPARPFRPLVASILAPLVASILAPLVDFPSCARPRAHRRAHGGAHVRWPRAAADVVFSLPIRGRRGPGAYVLVTIVQTTLCLEEPATRSRRSRSGCTQTATRGPTSTRDDSTQHGQLCELTSAFSSSRASRPRSADSKPRIGANRPRRCEHARNVARLVGRRHAHLPCT